VLPQRPPDRTWGGPGTGVSCTICGRPVEPHQTELEVEFVRPGDIARAATYNFHTDCFAAWESVLEKLAPLPEPAQRTRQPRPPLSQDTDGGKMSGGDRHPADKAQ
jgi:hypothetical protein